MASHARVICMVNDSLISTNKQGVGTKFRKVVYLEVKVKIYIFIRIKVTTFLRQ